MHFISQVDWPNQAVGKLVLCQVGSDVVLYGKFDTKFLWKNIELEAAKGELEMITDGIGFKIDDLVGKHKDIPHQGKILGGTQVAIVGQTLYLYGCSMEFGPVHPEAISLCLGGEWNIQVGIITRLGETLPPLDKYLRR